uniref:Pentatricopeptide repeat-containing protein n=1 Tax=Steinernema glaseri TaxID=37863 RepID=A0A1I7Z0K1_9BILA
MPSLEVTWTNSSFKIKPWPVFLVDRFKIDPSVPTSIITNLAISLIRMGRPQSVNILVEHLTKRMISIDDEPAYLDIARAYLATNKYDVCYLYLKILSQLGTFVDNPETWYLMGLTCTILSQLGTFVDNPETWYLMGLTCTVGKEHA